MLQLLTCLLLLRMRPPLRPPLSLLGCRGGFGSLAAAAAMAFVVSVAMARTMSWFDFGHNFCCGFYYSFFCSFCHGFCCCGNDRLCGRRYRCLAAAKALDLWLQLRLRLWLRPRLWLGPLAAIALATNFPIACATAFALGFPIAIVIAFAAEAAAGLPPRLRLFGCSCGYSFGCLCDSGQDHEML